MQRILGVYYLEPPEVAEIFGVAKQTVYLWLKLGKILAARHPMSHKYLIAESDVERLKAEFQAELRRVEGLRQAREMGSSQNGVVEAGDAPPVDEEKPLEGKADQTGVLERRTVG